MGIRGIYKEIGAGTRVSLLKLAIESLEQRRRPLRLAIDISIWQFQVQAARGGANPAIRTLFYRLVRLLGMPVQPVFVFDGLHKPRFKRNKRSGVGDGMATAMAKRLIRLFGFNVHDAPGEAEAECALLQQKGVVDAVLSEDVDTLMFGCTRTLRSWGPGGGGGEKDTASTKSKSKSTAPPTHVTMYDTETSLRPSLAAGLDRQGMVLVALMSGGDYLPEGVPGCGIKLACEAARAGFGRTLCQLKRSDGDGVAAWRATLQHELRTNESHTFRTLHHKLVIPESFPDLDVLRYYTHPVVSTAEVVDRVRDELTAVDVQGQRPRPADRQTYPIDVAGLRAFVAETFDWVNRPGAVKFIHVLAPSLLARMLLLRWTADAVEESEDDGTAALCWPSLVEGVSRQRCHPSTDGLPELRVSFVPAMVVGLDLAGEMDVPLEAGGGGVASSFGRNGLALNSDDELDEEAGDGLAQRPLHGTAAAAAAPPPLDPTKPTMAWIARAIIQVGAQRALETWDERQLQQQLQREQKEQRQKKRQLQSKNGAATNAGRSGAAGRGRGRGGRGRGRGGGVALGVDGQAGALDRFVQVTKKSVGCGDRVGLCQATPQAREEHDDVCVLSSDSANGNEEDGDGGSSDADVPVFSSPVATPSRPQPRLPVRRGAANPWSHSGAQAVLRVTKTMDRGEGGKTPKQGRQKQHQQQQEPPQQQKPQQPRQKQKQQQAAVVIDLLSSSPFPGATPSQRTADDSSRLPEQKMAVPQTPRKARKGDTEDSSTTKQASLHSFWSPSKSPSKPSVPASRSAEGADIVFDDMDIPSSPPCIASPPSPLLPLSPALLASPLPPSKLASVPTLAEKRHTRYVPRTSAVGYFREEEDEEGEEAAGEAHAAGGTQPRGTQRRGWRLSEVSTVDLTGLKE